ncbi:MAG TPA: hypothetical protein VMQ81_10740 [Acidimicrobiia bacterium]|nr:hypothetical protein [Acidimicrobiia bacterium]
MADQPPGDAVDRLAGQVGWRGQRRVAPFLSHALGAGGGALVALGVLVLGFDYAEDDASGSLGAALCALLVVAALVAMTRVPAPARSACVAAAVIAAPGLWFFLITVESSAGSLTGFYVLSIGTLVTLFLVGPTRGRAVLLGVALLFLWGWVVGEFADINKLGEIQTSSAPVNAENAGDGARAAFGGDDDFEDFDDFDDEEFEDFDFEEAEEFPVSGAETDAGIVSLLFGAAYLAATWLLDKRRLHGLATPFVAVGAIAAITGAIIVGIDAGAIGGGLLAVAVGGGLGWVAAEGGSHRRATTWIGALTATIGITVVVNDIADVDDSAVGFAILVIILGAAVAVGATFLGRFLGEPEDEQTTEGASTSPT